jgi:hypothetical protein
MVAGFERKYRKIAYGEPKDVKGAGKLLNTGARVGTKIVQFIYLRPEYVGYKAGRRK